VTGTSVHGKSNQPATPTDDAGSDPGNFGGSAGDGGSGGSGNSGSAGQGSGGQRRRVRGRLARPCVHHDGPVSRYPPRHCTPCVNGTTLCPNNECIQGSCVLIEPTCAPPIPCDTDNQCPITSAICNVCADGSYACPH
jgi:hypothetical protein